MKKYLVYILIFLNIQMAVSQDIHLSQFYDNPLIINPANTGNFDGNFRLINSFRNQANSKNSPFKTTTITFEKPIYYYTEKISIGIIFINDCANDNTLFTNKLIFSTAYFRKISSNSYLHLGLQGGIVNKLYSLDNLTFPDQFDMSIGLFNSNMQTAEIIEKNNKTYIDLNWGLMWSRYTENVVIQTGIAMFHFNMPNESFYDTKQYLTPKYVYNANLIMNFVNNYFISPKILYAYQKKASEMLIGNDFGKIFKNKQKIYLGLFFRGGFLRTQDALIIRTGIVYNNFEFSVNYDLEIYSKRTKAYTKTAFEIIIKYHRPLTEIKKIKIPCEIL